MVKCAYCNAELKKGTGMMYVYRTGDVAYYDTNKCFKNHIVLRKRINRKLAVREARVAPRTAEKK